jgi:hypothetical protein
VAGVDVATGSATARTATNGDVATKPTLKAVERINVSRREGNSWRIECRWYGKETSLWSRLLGVLGDTTVYSVSSRAQTLRN